jgi:dihydroorotate dehydrogenase
LAHLLAAIAAENQRQAGQSGLTPRPIWVKIAPDLTWNELDEVLATVTDTGMDGLIVANTTLSREGLAGAARAEAGGLSGRTLAERSTAIIAYVSRQTAGALPIIGVGGVSSAAEARAKLDAGACAVQLYTGLVYGGPGIAGRILRELAGPR